MKALQYKVKTLAPVVISATSGDANLTGTLDYLTGSSMLGVFASKYQAAGKEKATGGSAGLHRDEKFYRWFLRGGLSFGNAYLAVPDEENEYLFYPTPMSLQQDKEERIIYNLTLIDDNVEETRYPGGFSRLADNRLIYETPQKKLYFHHTRKNRLKGRSEDGDIFHYEALNEGQLFVGRILGAEEDLKEFRTLLGPRFLARVGRSKNTQYGRVEIVLAEIVEPVEDDQTELTVADNTVVLTFLSPVILRNRYGFPEVSVGILREYLAGALGTEDFTIKECYARTELVENFISVWQLKRPEEKALAAGSTFKLIFEREPDSQLRQTIKDLCRDGLGERTNEGFGRLTVNLAAEKWYSKEKLKPGKPEKPGGLLPEEAKTIFKNIVYQNLETRMAKEAVEKSEEFFAEKKKPLPNSLLGRLKLILGESGNIDEFCKRINNLRDTARDKLAGYRTKNESLYNVLRDCGLPDWGQFCLNIGNNIDSLAQLAGLKLEADQEIKDSLFRKYWLVFFRNTRKLNKRKGDRD